MPEFPERAPKALADGPLMAALQAWADAWRSRDEAAYFAAYAPGFRPEGKQTRSEWEKRRRLLFGVSRNVDLKIEDVTTEPQGRSARSCAFGSITVPTPTRMPCTSSSFSYASAIAG